MKAFLKLSPLAALLVVSAGCGGGGGTLSQQTSRVTVTPGTGYNGTTTELVGDATSNVTSEATTFLLTAGGRTLRILIPNELITVRNTIRFDAAGATFRYTEIPAGSPDTARWTATAGSIRIVKILFGEADVEVNGLVFSPLSDGTANSAAGSFTAQGKLYGIPIL